MIAFLDSNALIYLVQGREPWSAAVKEQLRKLGNESSAVLVGLSRLTTLECRVQPIRDGDEVALALFDAFFSRSDLVWVELSASVVDVATDLRARFGLRTPDALQASSCLRLGPEAVMITGDRAFERVPGLNLAVVA